ncbi:MAG: FkbM family methyltransferase [Synergistaceae bacterium]|nr:FkbM family methyltransferase [Synergistaceae bacterium]
MLRRVKTSLKKYLLNRWGIEHAKSCEVITSPEYYDELQRLLVLQKAEGYELVRTGREHDGGYILLNDFQPGGIAYSFGICNDVSWDKEMASRGYDVFMYDHTIDRLPEENPGFHWSKLGIADGLTQDDNLRTLDELIRKNHHENESNMILKMDVEGAEWGCFDMASSETLAKFSQISLEFHEIPSHSRPEQVLNVFRKLNMTHQLIHIHANNNGSYVSFCGKKFCSLFEMSYVLRGKYELSSDYDPVLPLSIDSTNISSIPEIELGRWNEHADIGSRITVHAKIW